MNDEQFLNKYLILFILIVFHFEISGNEVNDEHPKNKAFNVITFSIFL